MKNSFGPRPPFGSAPRPQSGQGDGPQGRFGNNNPNNNDENRINERIRVPEVMVIDENGVQLGNMPTREALAMARDRGLDLVEVAASARPPVCKFLDYGKLKYSKKKKSQEAKKKQVVVSVKEIQLRPRTENHDLETKFRHICEFLTRGDKVKITVMFRGREVAYAQQGGEMLKRIIESVKEFAAPESYPKMEGRRMIMVLAPTKSIAQMEKEKPVLVPLSAIQAQPKVIRTIDDDGNPVVNAAPSAPVATALAADPKKP